MTASMETKVMTPYGAMLVMMSSKAAPGMMNSVVIAMRMIVRTMMVSSCPAWAVMTNSMATLVMTYLMVDQRTTLVMEDLTLICALI
jgi:hypothetical protein